MVNVIKKHNDDVKVVHSKLLKMFVDGGLLARHIMNPAFKNQKIYPVVIGGVNVLRCARISKAAIELLGSVYKNDLDIKFVVNKTIRDNNDNTVRKADAMRRVFLEAIMRDAVIATKVRDLGKRSGVSIVLKLEDMTQTSNEMLMRNMMVNIYVEYIGKDGVLIGKKEFIDTGIYSNYSQELFKSYQRFFKEPLRRPIPVKLHNGIPFATCGWTYYDTIRMLILYGQRFRDSMMKTSLKNQRFQFLRYLKYLTKFVVLYVQINKINGGKGFNKIQDMYERARDVLSKTNIRDKTVTGVTLEQQDIMNALIDVLQDKTNLQKLQTSIENGKNISTLLNS